MSQQLKQTNKPYFHNWQLEEQLSLYVNRFFVLTSLWLTMLLHNVFLVNVRSYQTLVEAHH